MRAFICAISLLIFPFAASASPEIRWKTAGERTEFWILHADDGKFFVEHFEKLSDHLQDRLESFAFTSRAAAERKWHQVTPGFSTEKPERLSAHFAAPQVDPASTIWPTVNAWDVTWEARYRAWIETTATSNFLKDHGVATDCADVGYAFRWIFARINGLPMANALAGSNDLFTNESLRPEWKSLATNAEWDKDARFMAALNYLLDNTYTHSLWDELFPIAITPEQMGGGAIFLNLWSNETGHTQMVHALLLNQPENPGPLRMLASDVPRAVRELNEYALGNEDFPAAGKRGFLRFRWAVKTTTGFTVIAPEQMPGYSLDQFADSFSAGQRDITTAVLKIVMPNWNPNYPEAMKLVVTDLLAKLSKRATVVNDGFTYCQSNDCSPGTNGWESWSTPGRDAALLQALDAIGNLLHDSQCDGACTAEYYSHQGDVITSVGGNPYTVHDFIWRFIGNQCSSDPRDPITKRWGLH